MKILIKIIRPIILLIFAICIVSTFASCNVDKLEDDTADLNLATNSTEKPTEDLIEEPTKEITDDAEVETLPITPCPFAEESLDMPVDIKKEIQAAVLTGAYGEEYEKDGYTLEYAWVVCYGIFDNAYCVMVWDHAGAEMSVITEVKVGEYTFTFGSPNTMVVYNEGDFYSLNEAYNNGILDDADLSELYEYYNAARWGK